MSHDLCHPVTCINVAHACRSFVLFGASEHSTIHTTNSLHLQMDVLYLPLFFPAHCSDVAIISIYTIYYFFLSRAPETKIWGIPSVMKKQFSHCRGHSWQYTTKYHTFKYMHLLAYTDDPTFAFICRWRKATVSLSS